MTSQQQPVSWHRKQLIREWHAALNAYSSRDVELGDHHATLYKFHFESLKDAPLLRTRPDVLVEWRRQAKAGGERLANAKRLAEAGALPRPTLSQRVLNWLSGRS